MSSTNDNITAIIALTFAAIVGFIFPWTFVLSAVAAIAIWTAACFGLIEGLKPLAWVVLTTFAAAGTAIGALLSLFF